MTLNCQYCLESLRFPSRPIGYIYLTLYNVSDNMNIMLQRGKLCQVAYTNMSEDVGITIGLRWTYTRAHVMHDTVAYTQYRMPWSMSRPMVYIGFMDAHMLYINTHKIILNQHVRLTWNACVSPIARARLTGGQKHENVYAKIPDNNTRIAIFR